ncbi:sugar ABC transporter substrate-binding protein (plasmid) [Sinorhizobium meliloti WSM1022]|jgi:multiple sugar transport system substrate-binding protein|uniref:Sugar uptake ABC transporter periplasmic solute-binding protein n=4 Tax=Rhizobium meliloti TaxID=382 RepID=Q926F8_RHIME|nr:sugar ABC transporter substrate-binding protein [Sinorhizobium meliloti]TWB05409.1 carbohydrate ABC transporter substrate-binding protein (CUT1 family) [Ensifer sp. SEMIA 134]TWB41381.1 carbohydrate ABC transporter substrate-binding protein (CUT1 family) [Ensifer sp. SEMIA 135]AEG07887.1 extracellular solute-binding protein family 1 [Sinorhizobium meliloti BL225C]AEG56286.1 extracellular solute-binding protein family 1 [Sinorhizobium meliloti AK83]AGA10609.1 ABC-type sugar transport system,
MPDMKTTIIGALLALSVAGAATARAEEVLRFATWDTGESLAIQQAIAKKFEEKHPGVKVQVEPYAEGYDQKLVAAFGAGNPPDVMYMWNFPQYYTSLMPLDELIARDSAEIKPDDFPEGLMNTTRIEGKTYGMPSGFTTQVVFYNKEMFAKAGVEEPKEGWTWDDLRAKAAKFRDEAGKVYGFAVDAKPDPYDFEQFLWSNGTKYISDDGKEIDGYMNSDAAAAVLGMFADMARKEEAVTLHLGDETGGDTLFQGGKIAMFQSAMWDKADIDAAGFSYGVAPLPTFGDRPAHSALGVSAISIAKDAAHPDLAWEFVKFFSSPDSVAMRVNDLPVRKSVAEAKGMTKDPVYKPFFDILATSNTERHAYLKNANWGKIQDNLARAIEATMIDQGNAKAHLDDAVKRSKRLLK